MKLPLKSVRMRESSTISGKPSAVLVAGVDGFALSYDSDLEVVIVERAQHDAVFVPVGNVLQMTPLAQKPAAKVPAK